MQRDLSLWEKAGTLASSTFTCVLPLPFILPSLGAYTLFPRASKESGGTRKQQEKNIEVGKASGALAGPC